MTQYENPPYKFGMVSAGVWLHSQNQCLLMQEMIQREMVVRAGKASEKLLAQWFNEVEGIRRKAKLENWIGWEASHEPR